MPFSQIIPPSPSPTESKSLFYTSVSLLLSRTQGDRYHLSKFHVYVLVYYIGVFLPGLLHSVLNNIVNHLTGAPSPDLWWYVSGNKDWRRKLDFNLWQASIQRVVAAKGTEESRTLDSLYLHTFLRSVHR